MYLSVDVGGTSIKFAVIDENLKIVHYETCETPDNISERIVERIYKVASRIKKEMDFDRVGISTGGVIDNKKMKVLTCSGVIKNYTGTDFVKEIGEKLSVKVYADNDVNCALLGEQWLGAAKGLDEIFCIALGTGIGGAYYLDKTPSGSNFCAGEVGQMITKKGGETYETKASTIALEKMVKKEIDQNLTVIDFFERCKKDDEKCLEVLDKWLEELALGLVNILLMLDPKYVLIGGAISRQGDYLIEKIQNKVNEMMTINTNRSKFLFASLGNDAALYGAIAPLVKEKNKQN